MLYQNKKNMYFIHKIKKFLGSTRNKYNELLPYCEFVLSRKSSKITVIGFLPCHHSNIGYELAIENNKIKYIISIKTIKGKASVLPDLRSYLYPNYELIANEALHWVGLLVCSVIYTSWDLKEMDIRTQFKMLCVDIERSAIRGFPHACHLYNVERAIECIENALIIMMELPYNKMDAFRARMKWQATTQYDTATKKKPKRGGMFSDIDHVKLIEHNDVFCTKASVRVVQKLAAVFTPTTTVLVQGSLQDITGNIVVLNVEDAYRVRCQTGTACNIYMMIPHEFKPDKCRNLGITNIEQLPHKLDHLNVAFAHLWGVEEWTQLISFEALSYTIIGRLDQYPGGRGQFFRDMLESNRFPVSNSKHHGTDNIVTLSSDDIVTTVAEICRKHDTVQCFNTDNVSLGIDCGRRQLKNPYRIRSLRDRNDAPNIRLPKMPLYEETYNYQKQLCLNASEINIRRFQGVPVHVGVLICSENTTAFDIGLAKSHCRQALYLINGCNYFSMVTKPRSRCTVNPFTV
tara:strand:- start:155 stop:1705 length:1551 start_codon:yes stop_codon:yes gene_type:complete